MKCGLQNVGFLRVYEKAVVQIVQGYGASDKTGNSVGGEMGDDVFIF